MSTELGGPTCLEEVPDSYQCKGLCPVPAFSKWRKQAAGSVVEVAGGAGSRVLLGGGPGRPGLGRARFWSRTSFRTSRTRATPRSRRPPWPSRSPAVRRRSCAKIWGTRLRHPWPGLCESAGAPDHLWKWVKHSFRCPACSSGVLPKPARPAAILKSYSPNVVVAVDLLQIPTWDGSDTDHYLNMLCLGTNYQLIEKVRSKEPQAVCLAFMRSWARFLGFPQVLLLDQGTEFLAEFRDKANQFGILIHTIGARAPHQNGRCERHGGLFKAMMEKTRWSNPPTSSARRS